MSDPFAWRLAPGPRRLMAVLNEGGEARFVGGCVRDSLLGQPPGEPGATDIDIATTHRPDQVIEVLDARGIRYIPTGLDHGTVTAVLEKVPYEITTLRADVSTDGRRATVAFTADWAEDARRRDFTINAIYLSAAGEVFDPTDGREDVSAGRVRFIGNPADRIAEDYLRILRFMRFSARFADRLDPHGWAACVAAREGLAQLSKERIWSELARIFVARRAPMALLAAADEGILPALLSACADPVLFEKVHARGDAVPPALGLAALWPGAGLAALKAAFKPPNAVLDLVAGIGAVRRAGPMPLRERLYRFGLEATDGALRIEVALGLAPPSARAEIARAAAPVFPVRGADLLARGVPAGPGLGERLKRIEAAWIEAGLPDDPRRIDQLVASVLEV